MSAFNLCQLLIKARAFRIMDLHSRSRLSIDRGGSPVIVKISICTQFGQHYAISEILPCSTLSLSEILLILSLSDPSIYPAIRFPRDLSIRPP